VSDHVAVSGRVAATSDRSVAVSDRSRPTRKREAQVRRSATGATVGFVERLPIYFALALAVGAPVFLLAATSMRTLDSLWWVALVVVGLLLVIVVATAVMQFNRVHEARHREADREALQQRIRQALEMDKVGCSEALSRLFPRLREVREASLDFAPAERDELRLALIDAGGEDWLTRRVGYLRRKWKRAERIDLLGWLGSDASVDLLRHILAGQDVDLAYIAGQSLRCSGTPSGYAILSEALAAAWLPQSRVAALMENAPYKDALQELSMHTDDPIRMRRWVAYLLGRSTDGRVGEHLLKLTHDEDDQVRATAVTSVGFITAACADSHGGPQRFTGRLAELLEDESALVRSSAQIAAQRLRERT
jgi:HEAT repeat protein